MRNPLNRHDAAPRRKRSPQARSRRTLRSDAGLRRFQPQLEPLEQRNLLTTTVFLDFGDGFGAGGLNITAGQLRDITGPNTGPNLVGQTRPGGGVFAAADVLTLQSLNTLVQNNNFDFNGSGTVTTADTAAMEDFIFRSVQRAYDPFNIRVATATSANTVDMNVTLNRNAFGQIDYDGPEEFDAYVYVTGVFYNGQAVGSVAGLNSLAGSIDTGTLLNTVNEAAVVFAESTDFTLPDPDFVAQRMANSAAHSSGHTFGLAHVAQTTADQQLIARSEVMQASAGSQNNFLFFTRATLPVDVPPPAAFNTYNVFPAQLAGEPVQITGTGAHDRITITRSSGSSANVKVESFRNATVNADGSITYAPADLISTLAYMVSTVDGLIVEAGAGNDEVDVDADIMHNVDVRGGADQDVLRVLGTGKFTSTGKFDNVSYFATGAGAGNLNFGNFKIGFDEFEPLFFLPVAGTLSVFITDGSAHSIQVEDDGVAANGMSRVTIDGGLESIAFANPNTLIVFGSLGDDFFTLVQPDSLFTGNILLKGLDGDDNFTVDSSTGLVSTPATIQIDGGLGSNSLTFNQVGGAAIADDLLELGATPGNGRSTVDNTQVVSFSNVFNVIDFLTSTNFQIASSFTEPSFLQKPNEITIDDNRVTIDEFAVQFNLNKTNLIVSAGEGDDHITIDQSTIPLGGPTTITVNGGEGNDQIVALGLPVNVTGVTINGDQGDDAVDASRITTPIPFTINGGAGNDVLGGGAGVDTISGGDDDDTLISSAGNDTLSGGAGFDQILIKGTAANDAITAFQVAPSAVVGAAYQLQRVLNAVTSTISIVSTNSALAPNNAANTPDVEEVRVEAGNGNDTIRIGHADAYFASAAPLPNQLLRFSVDGGAPSASDRLIVFDDGLGDVVLVRESSTPGSGRVTVAPTINLLGDVVYDNVERVDIMTRNAATGVTTPVNPITGVTGTDGAGRVIVFQADPFEMNDNLLTASEFTDLATTHLNPTIDPGGTTIPGAAPVPDLPGDEDWYSFVPSQTSTFQLGVRFNTVGTLANGHGGLPGDGNLDIAVFDESGALIATGVTVLGFGEQVTFAAAKDQRVFLRVKGAPLADQFSTAINTYSAELRDADNVGPQITSVFITNRPDFNLFSSKATTPPVSEVTPLINSLSIGIQDLPPGALGFVAPAIGGGMVTDAEPNSTLATSQNVDAFFNLNSNPIIFNAQTIPHVTISGTGDGTFDYFSFTVDSTGDVTFDIDGANVDTAIHLFRADGTKITDNQDGGLLDPGSTAATDPFLVQNLTPGKYIIGVARQGSASGNGGITTNPLLAGDSYLLHISVPKHVIALNPGHFQVRGDANGNIPIQQISFIPDPPVVGQPATGTVILQFAKPLPDDRFTLTVFDSLTDIAGNKLDGESNASEPLGIPVFPSGNGISGGSFVARFTVDSRPEIGVYAGTSVSVDMNGNGSSDPANADSTNRDLVFQFGGTSYQRFAGKFAPNTLIGYDVLAAYGKEDGSSVFQFLIDLNGNGRVDAGEVFPSVQANGIAVAGNFDGNAANGDEIAIFTGNSWLVLQNGNFTNVIATVGTAMRGYPLAGDFDGNGADDFATFQKDTLFFDFNRDGTLDNQVHFGAAGVNDRAVAADMDMDGIDDVGIYVPYTGVGQGTGQWQFIISNGASRFNLPNFQSFSPAPLGQDVAYTFGDPFALPIVGNFDPPPTASPSSSGSTGGSSGGSGGGGVTAKALTVSQAQTLVASLYHDILGRDADPAGLSAHSSRLLAGVQYATIANDMLHSREYYGTVVDSLYATYLHRAADASGRAAWINSLAAGRSEKQIAADLVLSAEYAGANGGDAGFVDALYRDILGRNADASGKAYFSAALGGGMSRNTLVSSLMSSDEFRRREVSRLYQELLGRKADAGGLQAFSAYLGAGGNSSSSLKLTLIASDEYFAKHYGV